MLPEQIDALKSILALFNQQFKNKNVANKI